MTVLLVTDAVAYVEKVDGDLALHIGFKGGSGPLTVLFETLEAVQDAITDIETALVDGSVVVSLEDVYED